MKYSWENDLTYVARLNKESNERLKANEDQERKYRRQAEDLVSKNHRSSTKSRGQADPESKGIPKGKSFLTICAILFLLYAYGKQSNETNSSSTQSNVAAGDGSTKIFSGEFAKIGQYGWYYIAFPSTVPQTFSPDVDVLGHKYSPPFVVQMSKSASDVVKQITVARIFEFPWVSKIDTDAKNTKVEFDASFHNLRRYAFVIECTYTPKAKSAEERKAVYWYQATRDGADPRSLKAISASHPLLAIGAPRHSCPSNYGNG